VRCSTRLAPMSDNQRPAALIQAPEDEGGVVAELPIRPALPLFIAPSTADQRNTYRPDIFPVACLRLDDLRFGFGSSFVGPGVTVELRRLATLLHDKPGVVASVFGHADPVGDDDSNKTLSGRRAAAIYGVLTRDIALWERLFSTPFGLDDWGLAALQLMLAVAGHFTGALDGVGDDPTAAAIRRFQSSRNLPADGALDADTRAALFLAYMNVICVDDAGQPFTMAKTAFLGKGVDPGGKADYQGCGEFNPIRVFSVAEAQRFSAAGDQTERDAENANNRRVVIYLFRPGTHIDPSRWPCPRAEEGSSDCSKRFWSDAPARRRAQAQRREFESAKDTFACRFYHRFADFSPCERTRPAPAPTALVAGRLPSLCSVGKTFPKPSSIPMLREVARRSAEDPSTKVLIVGHTDRTGADAMNQALSRGRAAAVRAFLLGDAAFFRSRFDAPDPVSAWDWEEIQWMLSAIEIDGDPCYAAFVDGHCSDMTLAALQTFQLAMGLDANHLCGDATLSPLIDKYLETLGPKRPAPEQIEILGGGSWHAPRTFGQNSAPVQDLLSSADDLPGYRRVEVFMGRGPFRPPTRACSPARHVTCFPYESWCKATAEELAGVQSFTMAIRLVDVVGEPLSAHGVDVLECPPGEDETLVASLTTTRHGLIRLTVPAGLYALRFDAGAGEQRAAFYVYPDEVGGMTVRLDDSRARMRLKGHLDGTTVDLL
jgi:outer membrane protein OmpA-like peptidoglycan-associated protein